MKMKFINKILAGFLAASTIYAVSGVVFANPKKHLCSLQNIYDLKESCESDQSDNESDEEDDEQNSDARSKGQSPISQFVFLLNKPVLGEWDQENFFEICSDFSENGWVKMRLWMTLLRLCRIWLGVIFLKNIPLNKR